jgi:hypothetical protein
MHSTSKLTCPDRTSATVRGSVMTGSGRTGRKATYRQQAVHTGAQRATASIRPEPFSLSPARRHGSPGWGEAPLGTSADDRADFTPGDMIERDQVAACR